MKKKRIMIVDDDKEFLEELQELLSLSGYDTFSLGESTLVLDTARKNRPDLILLDMKMEGIDGFQLVQLLKQYPETKNIPIIAMTGYFTKKEHEILMNICGIEPCLKKPFNPLEVISRIEKALA